MMNGRLFGGHPISCFYWDGKTDYRRGSETEEEEKKRIQEFGKWLGDKKASKEGEAELEGEQDEEPEEKPKEPEVSSEVAEAIQKIVDEKLAQLKK
jgi:hypothetical protein